MQRIYLSLSNLLILTYTKIKENVVMVHWTVLGVLVPTLDIVLCKCNNLWVDNTWFALMRIYFTDISNQNRHVITQILSSHQEHTFFFSHILWRHEIAYKMYYFRPNFRHVLDSFSPSQYNHVNMLHGCDNHCNHIATSLKCFPGAIFFECHNIHIYMPYVLPKSIPSK